MPRVELKLNDAQFRATKMLAEARDVTMGQILRDALDAALDRAFQKGKAKTPNRADERLVAPLRALLADDFAYASTWAELQSRLQKKGYFLQESGGGLALYTWPAATRVCKGSELGYSYRLLVNRFQRPFPGHSHHRAALKYRAAG